MFETITIPQTAYCLLRTAYLRRSRLRAHGALLIGLATFASATASGQDIERDPINLCHSSSANQGYPGHLVRSLFVDRGGIPMLASGSFRTDHASPLAERWGGWYVTGTSGRQKHLGNMIAQRSKRPEKIDNADGVNVVDLKNRFTTSFYLTPHSDIVALMVLEHQTGMLNRLARAGMETRMALHERPWDREGRPSSRPGRC